MKKPKLIISFPRSNLVALIARLKFLLSKIEGNQYFQEPFPPGYPSLASLKTAVAELEKARLEALAMDRDKIAYRNKICEDALDQFKKLARHFEAVADGNEDALRSTGFDLAKIAGRNLNKKVELRDAPEVQIRKGKTTGSIFAKWKKIVGACIEAHVTHGDPTVEENWEPRGLCSGAQMEITGFTVGKYCFLRFRCVNEAGAGAWSAPYRFMPT